MQDFYATVIYRGRLLRTNKQPSWPEAMKTRLRLVGHGERDAAEKLPQNPFYTPMSSAPPNIRRAIWSRIFDFAIRRTDGSFSIWYSKDSPTWSSEYVFDTRVVEALCQTSLLFKVRSFGRPRSVMSLTSPRERHVAFAVQRCLHFFRQDPRLQHVGNMS